MKRKYRQRIGKKQCPCCKAYVSERDRQQYIKAYTNWIDKKGPHYVTLENSYKMSQWACDACITSKKAILAKPKLQHYGGYSLPRFMYYNKERTCVQCGVHFTFDKEEQRFWYEELQFEVSSMPTRCINCRKERRKMIAQNNRIMELTAIENKTIDQLKELAALYEEIGSEQKANEVKNLIKK